MAAIALAHSMAVVRPGASAPGSDSLWLGKSTATTRYPASTSGLTNTAKCGRWPPQPCTRYIGGPAPHSSPATRCPSQYASIGLPGDTPGGMRRLDSRTGGVHHNSTAHRDPREGAARSSSQKSRRTRAATGGRTPEPATSSGATGPGAPSVMNRDRSMGRPVSALWDSRALGAGHLGGSTEISSRLGDERISGGSLDLDEPYSSQSCALPDGSPACASTCRIRSADGAVAHRFGRNVRTGG